jgi:hypothetical protein
MKIWISLLVAVVVASALSGSADAAELSTPSLFLIAGGPTTADCMVTNVSGVPRAVTISILSSLGDGTGGVIVGSTGSGTVSPGGVLSHRETIGVNLYIRCQIEVNGPKSAVRGSMCVMQGATIPGCHAAVAAE